MIKQEIKYIDFNGIERKEDFYFHLSLPEVARLEAELGAPMGVYAKQISEGGEVDKLLAFLEKIILNSYGKKTIDGKSFIKSPEMRNEFEYSQAYAELFEELLLNPGKARKFGELVAETGKTKKNQVEPTVQVEN